MRLDIRFPIGLMFAIFGVILTVFGIFSNPSIYGPSLGININLAWGLVLLAFGGLMLVLGLRGVRAGDQDSIKNSAGVTN